MSENMSQLSKKESELNIIMEVISTLDDNQRNNLLNLL